MINDRLRVSTAGPTAGLVKAGYIEVNRRDAVLSAISRVSITMPDPEDLPLTAARSAFRMGHF